ncbi:hypothetical protein [Roseobacter sp. MH60115]|uniref:hypothetical protein n=1 Tax=Roseobacter sp. MH60115 TaxID=2785324 RepID=UPI0018A31002|nr:hypothetical protein [Roseobacter sp. MH60115]
MSLDPITEKIAHFIGSFNMLDEQARMRAEYEEFRALRAAEEEAARLELATAHAKQSYKLKDYDPELKYKVPPQALTPPERHADTDLLPLDVAPEIGPIPMFKEAAEFPILGVQQGGAVSLNFNLPLPAAVATVTYQVIKLFDNDIFGEVAAYGVLPIAQLTQALEQLGVLAEDLSLIPFDQLSIDADWFEIVADVSQAAADVVPGSDGLMSVALFQGEAAQAMYVNGVEVESLPEWKDIVPAYHAERIAQAEEEDAEAEEMAAKTHGPHDFDRDFEEDAPNPFKVDAGHEVVAGANTLINTVAISSSWLDAPVFAVSGDVLRFDAISQVNILVENDLSFGEKVLDGTASKTINAASIDAMTRDEARIAAAAEAEDAGPSDIETVEEDARADSGSPANWVVVRHEGDIDQFNWVKQYTFSTDMDQAVLSFSGAATFLGLGENAIANSFTTQQFGFGYDLIVVGGDMIDVSLVNQHNVVLDSDTLAATSPVTAPSAGVAQSNGLHQAALAQGVASTGATAAPAHPMNFDVAMHPTGALSTPAPAETTDMAAQGSADGSSHRDPQGLIEASTHAAPGESMAQLSAQGLVSENSDDPGPPPDVGEPAAETKGSSSADNLLYNKASIEKIGVDIDAEVTQNFADAISALSEGAEDVSEAIVEDDLFNGTELLRVLYIDGDFTTVNALDQTNILGDSDQVHIARDDFAAALQEEITVTTGSNIAANFAAIRDNGVDSTVMAQGDTYSDALIHQANLVETDAMPTDATSISALANEAVAFLAEDLIDPGLAENIVANTNHMIADAMSQQTDGMETILT